MGTRLIKSVDAAPLTEAAAFEKILAKDAATPAPEEAPAPKEEANESKDSAATDDQPDAEDLVTLSADELREIVAEKLAEAEDSANKRLEAATAEAERKAAELQRQLEETNAKLTAVTDKARARALLGRALPKPPEMTAMFNTTSPKSADAWLNQGRLGEWFKIHDSAETKQITYAQGTRIETHRDGMESFAYWIKNRDAMRSEIEGFAKASGYLMGSRDAATARTDIPEMLLTHLSNLMRVTHQTRRVYWQFPVYVEDFARGPGDNVVVPRWNYLADPAATADFTLTPGTTLATTLQNIAETEVPITLQELGLGKNGVANFEPIGLPEFWMARSIQNLEAVVMSRLGQHYEKCLDFLIRTQYFTTTVNLYNENGTPTITPGNVGTGDDGTMTDDFLMGLYGYMSGLQVPTLADGNYVIVMHTTAATQFKKSLADRFRYTTEDQTKQITNILAHPSTQGQVVGYLGNYCNFHIFETNAHSLGAAGTEGAQNVTLGTGSTLTRTSLAFGRDAVGHAVGMPVQVRRSNDDDFGRLGKFIWLSHETAATLDVDPNNNASEQQRVFEVRTIDNPV